MENCYLIKAFDPEWKDSTTYYGTIEGKEFCYYVDSLDECIGEIQRLAAFVFKEATARSTKRIKKKRYKKAFELAYLKFIEQADKNAITKKSEGSKNRTAFQITTYLTTETFHSISVKVPQVRHHM